MKRSTGPTNKICCHQILNKSVLQYIASFHSVVSVVMMLLLMYRSVTVALLVIIFVGEFLSASCLFVKLPCIRSNLKWYRGLLTIYQFIPIICLLIIPLEM